STGRYRVSFSAEGFLNQAKGPFAERFQSLAPDHHGWRKLLAMPHQNTQPTPEQTAERAQWAAMYQHDRDAAAKDKQPVPIEFPPSAPYHDWANQIAADWNDVLSKVNSIDELDQAQMDQNIESFLARKQQLADYLADQAEDIVTYQHELWRLSQWQ